MTFSLLHAQEIPVQEKDFIQLAQSQGAEKATEYFQQFHKSYPDSILFRRNTINKMGWDTAGKGNLTEAIELFELNLLAYPEHDDPWDSHAEAVLMRGEKDDINTAIRDFERSLELNPGNSNASLRLLVLKNYTKHVFMIPMRDGVRLYTQVYIPRDSTKSYPILYKREWYGVKSYGPEYRKRLHPNELFVKEGFIFVFQDIRGRFMSEGNFEVLRPYIKNKTSNKDIDESTDAYDTVDWLLQNLVNHNGRVGIYGGSYSGWATLMAALEPHPAVRAVLTAASPADWWKGDDLHHNGAFRLMYAYSWVGGDAWPRKEGPTSNPASGAVYETNDGYQFFLDIGPVKDVNERYFHDENTTWNDYMLHGDYDNFWKERDLLQHLNKIRIPVLHVAGWFDAEDYRGPLMIYETIEKNNPDIFNSIVIGPWNHGGWNGTGEKLGDIYFESDASDFFRREIEFPFFMQYLVNDKEPDLPEALVFQTGENQWKKFDSWPPTGTQDKKMYMEDHGRLTWNPGNTGENQSFDEFLSDPNKPVPWSSSIQTQQGSLWMIADQRFAASRPDVLVYKTEPLKEDLTIAGPIIAHVSVSSSGTDADWIVKVIDVYPGDAGRLLGDYQMLLAGDVIRSKYRNNPENPEALVPNQVTEIEFNLLDKFHTFKKGHSIMVQVQSTWFPVIDRNPQKFCNIYEASEGDFQKAFQRLYHTEKYPSYILFKTLNNK
jgi:putative CocE/NonD family hydrolase